MGGARNERLRHTTCWEYRKQFALDLCRDAMSNTYQHIDDLQQDLTMLKLALELFDDAPTQARVLTRIGASMTEYLHLVDGHLSAIIEAEGALSRAGGLTSGEMPEE